MKYCYLLYYDSVWLMCGHWWHICYRSLLSILRKKVGESTKEIGNLNGQHKNSYNLWIHTFYEVMYMNSYNLWIHIIWTIFSSIVHKGYFRGHHTETVRQRQRPGSGNNNGNEAAAGRWQQGSGVATVTRWLQQWQGNEAAVPQGLVCWARILVLIPSYNSLK